MIQNRESVLTATVICRYYSSWTPELKTVISPTANINGGKLSAFSSTYTNKRTVVLLKP